MKRLFLQFVVWSLCFSMQLFCSDKEVSGEWIQVKEVKNSYTIYKMYDEESGQFIQGMFSEGKFIPLARVQLSEEGCSEEQNLNLPPIPKDARKLSCPPEITEEMAKRVKNMNLQAPQSKSMPKSELVQARDQVIKNAVAQTIQNSVDKGLDDRVPKRLEYRKSGQAKTDLKSKASRSLDIHHSFDYSDDSDDEEMV